MQSTELKKAKDQIQQLTDSINANYSKMESYMKEERTFRSHVIDCFEELKNMKGFINKKVKQILIMYHIINICLY